MSITKASPSLHTGSSSLACPYCATEVATAAFDIWPKQPRLATGRCPGCARDITVPVQWLLTPPVIRLPEQAPRA